MPKSCPARVHTQQRAYHHTNRTTTNLFLTTIMTSSSIKNPDLLALKAYIQAQDGTAYQALDPDLVVVDVTHSNLQQRHVELRFYKQDSLATLRQRIHRQTGTPPADQHLQVYDGGHDNAALIADIPADTPDEYQLARCGIVQHGLRIHCLDTNPYSGSAGGAYEDTSLVPKFVLSDAEYAARPDTLRAWAQAQQAQNPDFTLRQHAAQHRALVEAQRAHRLGLALPPGFFVDSAGKVVREEPDVPDGGGGGETTDETAASSVQHASVGDRCQVTPGGRRGCVAYVGKIPPIGPGFWVGVHLDEPLGQNDGSFGGQSYFTTRGPKYGCVVRGKNVQVGDFPEEDWLDDDDDDDDEDEL